MIFFLEKSKKRYIYLVITIVIIISTYFFKYNSYININKYVFYFVIDINNLQIVPFIRYFKR